MYVCVYIYIYICVCICTYIIKGQSVLLKKEIQYFISDSDKHSFHAHTLSLSLFKGLLALKRLKIISIIRTPFIYYYI